MLIALNLLHESFWKKNDIFFTCYMLHVIFFYFLMLYSCQNDWCSRSREIDIPKSVIISVRPKNNVIIRIRSNNGSSPFALALTEREFFAGIGWQREAKKTHGRYEHTGDDEVEAVIQRPPTNVNGKSHVFVRSVRTTRVILTVFLRRHAWKGTGKKWTCDD